MFGPHVESLYSAQAEFLSLAVIFPLYIWVSPGECFNENEKKFKKSIKK
jgi:hypothetical protein